MLIFSSPVTRESLIRALRLFRQPDKLGLGRTGQRKNLKSSAKCGEIAEKPCRISVLSYYLLFLADT
jgi:hypothetical protein